ncbi:MAG: hypothetical protein HZB99_00440 [Candidatus Harrisonbacteria bacterium]|nr:hypothetical protein [Candidatus Harrisonbacteria bacterium]
MGQQKTARFEVLDEVRVRNVSFLYKFFFSRERRQLFGRVGYVMNVARGDHSGEFIYAVAFQDEQGLKGGCFFENELESVAAVRDVVR